jgi:hypothetical protein
MTDLQGNMYQVTPASRGETWEEAYRREIQASRDAYRARYGWAATHVHPQALDLNGLQVTEEFIGRGSLALWGAEEAEPEPPPENGKEGVYKCRRCEAEPLPGHTARACWHCGYGGET